MSKKLTIEELRKAQDLQAELFGLLSTKVGHATHWNVSLELCEFGTNYKEEYAKFFVTIEDGGSNEGFCEEAILADWAMDNTFDNLKAKLTGYINERYQ